MVVMISGHSGSTITAAIRSPERGRDQIISIFSIKINIFQDFYPEKSYGMQIPNVLRRYMDLI
ncbi:hypothetical protein [Candidatus Liberibacter sp.]|uniref:hypothetical protein n=1 Tax=Candidatus Liberibacter sp. TaxID=34022 RepID=UPI0015F4B877|nr:hypothetical protein [Candidatus Liberibacter sp.]MBA5724483.1 hypothetical protein [Candidatus Liberibacter sp.]